MSHTKTKTMLVVGATGVIGRRVIQHLDAAADWRAVGVSRRKPAYETAAAPVSADLMDKDDCRAKLGALDGVTHLLYAAYSDRPTWAAQCAPNALMLENVLDGIEFNFLATAKSGETVLYFPLTGAAEAVRRFRICAASPEI